MSAAVEGFVTGFASTLAQNVMENKQRARDYFDKQVEFARTTGMENRRRVREQVNTNLSVARQLESVGVPKEVIMAQVNQDPQGLSNFYDQVEKIRSSAGRDLTPDEWKAVYKVAGDFKAPDEDLATFISRTYDPIANAASDPGFSDEPEGTLISRMMGFNAMDQARARLGQTEVADGLTAEQLIQYGDVTPQRVGGNAVVTTNYGALSDTVGEEELSITERNALIKVTEEAVVARISEMESNPEFALTEGQDVTELRDQVVQEISDLYPTAPASFIKQVADMAFERMRYTVDTLPPEDEALGSPETPVEAPLDVPVGEGSQETQSPSTEPPTAPTDNSPITEPNLITIDTAEGRLTLVRDNGDGTSLYMDENGNEYDLDNAQVRKMFAN